MLEALEGRTYGPYQLRVSSDRVSEFVNVTRDNPDRWQEHAPPGWAASALFVVAPRLLADPDLEAISTSVIHGEQRFEWAGPIPVESHLHVTGRIGRIRERGDVFFVGFDLEVGTGGPNLLTGYATFLMSSVAPPGGDNPETNEPGPFESGANDQLGQLGDGFGEIRRSASRMDLIRYAAATSDWNPIHWDHQSAVKAGLSGIVVHGLLQAAWLLSGAAQLSPRPDPFADARFRFRSPLRAGAQATVTGQGSSPVGFSLIEGDREFVSATINLR